MDESASVPHEGLQPSGKTRFNAIFPNPRRLDKVSSTTSCSQAAASIATSCCDHSCSSLEELSRFLVSFSEQGAETFYCKKHPCAF